MPDLVALGDLVDDRCLSPRLKPVEVPIEAVDKHLRMLHAHLDEVGPLSDGLVTIVEGKLDGDCVGLREGAKIFCCRADCLDKAIWLLSPQGESPNEVSRY